MTYPGGKNGGGVYQRIINHMPPHLAYIEPFLGSGAVLRNKRPANRNIGIDRSKNAIDLCTALAGSRTDIEYINGDALMILDSIGMLIQPSDTLVYCDPPYLAETRKGSDLYDHELTDDDHETLLDILATTKHMVMISGYRSTLYDARLIGFHRVDYMANTRRGMVPESLWMNFPPPVALHDYSHLGGNYRERERIKRKKARWAAKIEGMDRQERLAIMDVLTSEIES